MNIQYKLTEEDYVNMYLFSASQIPRLMKRAKSNRVIGMIAFGLIAISLGMRFMNSHNMLFLVGCLLCIVVAVFYSKICLLLYKNTYKREFKVKYATGGDRLTLSLDIDHLSLADNKGQYTMKTSDIISFTEVNSCFYIQMLEEHFLSLPKRELQDIDSIWIELKEYASEYKIPYKEKLDWNSNIYSKKSSIN